VILKATNPVIFACKNVKKKQYSFVPDASLFTRDCFWGQVGTLLMITLHVWTANRNCHLLYNSDRPTFMCST